MDAAANPLTSHSMGPDAVARRGRRPGDLRVVVRRAAKLPRTLGAPSLFAASYGNVGSSIYYALGVTAAFALGLTPLALILAGLIFVSTALNYAEGSAALPHAGGSSQFARRAFNAPIGFLVGWVQLLNYTATVSISAYFAISYLGVFEKYFWLFSLVRHNELWHVGATVALIAILLAVNVIGIQESSAINLVLAMTDLVTQFALVILGLIFLLNINVVIHNVHLGVAPTWGNFLASISIAMVTYTGIETISNMSEEVKNPGRSVPRATFAVIVAVLFVSAFLPTIGMSVFPVHLDAAGHYTTALATTYKNDPVAGIVTGFSTVAHLPTLAFWAGIWVGFLAFTILVIATNAGLIGISRLSYSLAGADLLPHRFARLHPKFKTPYISIIVFGIAAAVLVLPGIFVRGQEIDLLGTVYALAATFAFCSAHLSVMRLRFIEPNLYRPYRMPWNIKFGRDSIPVLSLLGALAIGTVFTQLMSQNISNSTYIYLGWLMLGGITFVIYRRHRKLPLWEPLEVPPPLDREIERLPAAPLPSSARYKHGRRVAAHVAVATQQHRRHRPGWQLEFELFFARHGAARGVLIVMVFAAVSGLAVGVDLSNYDPFGPGLGWSPGIVLVALIAAYLLNRSHSEQ